MTPRPRPSPDAAHRAGPFFILGAPRSGTSLLSRMLDAHPAIAVPDETKIFETFAPLLPLYGDLRRPDRLRRLVRDVLAWCWVRRLPDLPGPGDVLQRVERHDLGGVFEAFLSAWAARRGKRRCGEKDAEQPLPLAVDRAHLPGRRSRPHPPRRPRRGAVAGPSALRPEDDGRRGQAVGRVRRPDPGHRRPRRAGHYVEIRYEDLLADPRGTIQMVLRFLGEPFHPDVLRFHRSERPVGTDAVNDENILRPLQAGNAGKWRTGASRRGVAVFESIAGATLSLRLSRATRTRPMRAAERAARRYLEHPPRRAWAMLHSRAGLEEPLERERLRWRLRAEAALGRGGGTPGGGWGYSGT